MKAFSTLLFLVDSGLDCNWTVNEEGRYLDCHITDYRAYKTMKLARFQNHPVEEISVKVPTIKVHSTTSTAKSVLIQVVQHIVNVQ